MLISSSLCQTLLSFLSSDDQTAGSKVKNFNPPQFLKKRGLKDCSWIHICSLASCLLHHIRHSSNFTRRLCCKLKTVLVQKAVYRLTFYSSLFQKWKNKESKLWKNNACLTTLYPTKESLLSTQD